MVANNWDIVVSSLQDIYNANEVTQFDDDVMSKRINFDNLRDDQLQSYLNKLQEHLENINRANKLLETVKDNVQTIMNHQKEESVSMEPVDGIESMGGRQYWISQYNASDPVVVGSEVAYKPRKGGDGEWFQCEVIRVSGDRIKYEVRDPEPDELGNTGKLFKCTWKELILIPSLKNASIKSKTLNYPPGTKVLARYPETTTFYPAVVIGSKRDGTCRLKFDGEEEVNKETEVPRRLVLPFPMASAMPAKK